MPVYEIDDNTGGKREIDMNPTQVGENIPMPSAEPPITFPEGAQVKPQRQNNKPQGKKNSEINANDYNKGYSEGYADGFNDGKNQAPSKGEGTQQNLILWKVVFKEASEKGNQITVVASAPTFDGCVDKIKKRFKGSTILSITMLDNII